MIATIDSAAFCSVITEDLANKCNMSINEDDTIEFLPANNVSSKSLGSANGQKSNRLEPRELDLFYTHDYSWSPSALKEFFLQHFHAICRAQEVKTHPRSSLQCFFSYGNGWNYTKVEASTIRKWVGNWLSAAPNDRKEYPFLIKIAADNVSAKEYGLFIKETEAEEARSTTVEFLQEQNPDIDGPQSAWETWAKNYEDDPTCTTTAIPAGLTQFFTRVNHSVDNDDDIERENEAIFQFIAQEIVEARDHAMNVLQVRTENLISIMPSLIRSARKRVSSVARLSIVVAQQLKRADNAENSHQ
ncbi:hypothetical protein P9112_006910 [Eukaryota sp. TZLM1-RC]